MCAMLRNAGARRAPPHGTTLRCLRSRLGLVLASATVASTSAACSLVFDLNATQCTIDGDCAHFGGEYTCSAGVCVKPGGAGGAGGNPTTSATSGGGASTTSTSTGTTSSSGTTDSGAPECTTNQDCITANNGAPFICRAGSCQPLTHMPDCPFVIASADPTVNPTDYLTWTGSSSVPRSPI
jgi:hypothetical protein